MCDIKVFKNASRDQHKFGTCNYTEFVQKRFFADILRSCGWNANSCSDDCKYYINQLDSHRCMKGSEGKMVQKTMMRSKANATIKAVFNARKVCTQGIRGDSMKITPHLLMISFMAILFALAN